MSIQKVFVIYHPYLGLSSKLYYVCNTEWSFEIKEARFFRSKEDAQANLNRLQDKYQSAPEVKSHGLDPNLLVIESANLDVDEYILISVED